MVMPFGVVMMQVPSPSLFFASFSKGPLEPTSLFPGGATTPGPSRYLSWKSANDFGGYGTQGAYL
jgi:hypothetical protein